MASSSSLARSVVCGLAAILLALVSAFFVFYTARLLYVTHGLRVTRAGGQGAYVGPWCSQFSRFCSAGALGVLG